MDHLNIAKKELAEFIESPAREHLEIAKVHSFIAIGEGLKSLVELILADANNTAGIIPRDPDIKEDLESVPQ
jgi:hypothetical protein